MKKIIVGLIIIFTICSIVSAQEEENFEGMWATNTHIRNSTRDSTFLSINKIDKIHYVVVSVSKTSDRFTYIGGGQVNSDGVLVIHTDKGDVWTFAFGFSTETDAIIGLSDLNMEDVFDSYVKINEKLTQWPEKWK